METAIQSVAEQFGSIEFREEQTLIGIWGRTDNQKEMHGEGIIPKMWSRFYTESIAASIPNILTEGSRAGLVYAAYFDIDSDDRGPYSFFIGAEVTSTEQIPEDMISLRVSAGRFLKVSTKWGSFETIGIDAWMNVWASEELRAMRRFDVDLEVYGADSADPANGRFDLCIGI
jgi:predicted transcriptional regulator YdeE